MQNVPSPSALEVRGTIVCKSLGTPGLTYQQEKTTNIEIMHSYFKFLDKKTENNKN